MSKKINKFKEIMSSKKKKAIEATTGKFVSNGSLLSQNGLRNSEAELQNKIGGGEYWSVHPWPGHDGNITKSSSPVHLNSHPSGKY